MSDNLPTTVSHFRLPRHPGGMATRPIKSCTTSKGNSLSAGVPSPLKSLSRRAERGGAKEVALALGNASRAGHDRVRRGLAHRGASTSGAGDRTGRLRRREIGDGGDSGGVVFTRVRADGRTGWTV